MLAGQHLVAGTLINPLIETTHSAARAGRVTLTTIRSSCVFSLRRAPIETGLKVVDIISKKPQLSPKTTFALQQALSGLSGRYLDAYFQLVPGGSNLIGRLTEAKISIAKRAQELVALAKKNGDSLYDVAEQFLLEIEAGQVAVHDSLLRNLYSGLAADGVDLTGTGATPITNTTTNKSNTTTDANREWTALSAETRNMPKTSNMHSFDKADKRSVFLVQGRNDQVNVALTDYLTSLDLRVLEWNEVVTLLGGGNPYIGDVIKKGMDVAAAIIVLFTPDDEVKLDSRVAVSAKAHELETGFQPRPNVLIEAGMALAKDEQKTLIVQWGDIRPATDLGGKHLLVIGDGVQWRHDLKQRLASAGLAVHDANGRYLRAGSFPKPLPV